MAYAGFWKRLVAYIIDYVITFVIGFAVGFLFGIIFGIIIGLSGSGISEGGQMFLSLIGYAIGLVIFWLYFALLESSAKQATVGKMALGIKVVGADGQRISFKTATIRTFSKILSAIILCIGFIMAAFTQKKQALHDLIAKTYVINA